jgi:hypothetical protein
MTGSAPSSGALPYSFASDLMNAAWSPRSSVVLFVRFDSWLHSCASLSQYPGSRSTVAIASSAGCDATSQVMGLSSTTGARPVICGVHARNPVRILST